MDEYYTRISGIDYQRIPLIKPFELIKMKGNNSWSLNTSQLPKEAGDLSPIDLIYCTDSFIYGYKSDYQDPEWEQYKTPESWFVIDISNSKLITYTNESDFINTNVTFIEKVKMKSPDFYFNSFKKEYILPWFNDTIKNQLKKDMDKTN
ncbi:hypothetical protein [Moheibacter lacus]|nr:hypothetical protein [Moheibacter lacus]